MKDYESQVLNEASSWVKKILDAKELFSLFWTVLQW
jgi:hypothetical protein